MYARIKGLAEPLRVVAIPTEEAGRLIASLEPSEAYAVLHVTC